ncbi:MAG: universal stress protein [Synechococcus sp.]
MYRKILVALDRSDIADRVLDEAIDLAKAAAGSLMLVHVLTSEEEGAPQAATIGTSMDYWYASTDLLTSYRDSWKRYEQDCQHRLEWQAEHAKKQGLEVEWSQQFGPPGRSICELADAWKADLIVMGRHGRRGLSELLMGSVSNYVTHHARSAVLLVGLPADVIDERTSEEWEQQTNEDAGGSKSEAPTQSDTSKTVSV